MQDARVQPYRRYFTAYRHEELRMRRRIRTKQHDLFAVVAAAPLSLPVVMRSELVSLLSALLLEVVSHQRSHVHRAHQEPCHEQQDHA
jgi:hypothetical protein